MSTKRRPAVASNAGDRQRNTDRCIMMKQKALDCLDTLSTMVKEEAVAQPFSSATATEVVVEVSALIDTIEAKRHRREQLRARQRAIHRRIE